MLRDAFSRTVQRFSTLISVRSVLRHRQHPSRKNSIQSLIFMMIVLPFALVASPLLYILTVKRRERLRATVLAVDGEFAPVIELMELLRTQMRYEKHRQYVLVLSKYRHKALDSLYADELKCRIIRSSHVSLIFQQILLLQPRSLVSIYELRGSRSFVLPQHQLRLTQDLIDLRIKTLNKVGIGQNRYVAMAVYTLQYDEERDPKEAQKHAMLESHGNNLAVGVDYLHQTNVGVVMLGSRDTKKAWVPRDIPRLSNFGRLGGADEVVLASGCEYFWNDSDVGAWWLGLPFKRPILTTNKPRIRMKTNLSDYQHLVVPVRYARPDGSDLTFRELLKMKSAPFKSAARGEIVMIRNSPDEIIEAHKEIRARISGTWSEDAQIPKLRDRCQQIFLEFPDTFPMRISAHFLTKHAHLLD